LKPPLDFVVQSRVALWDKVKWKGREMMSGEHQARETATPDEGGELDPETAARLLEETTRRARRQFEPRTPLLMVIAAATVLIAYGAVWLSVRNQHPYTGPSGVALAVLYGTLIVWAIVVATFRRRATSGVSGRSARERRIVGTAFGTVWVAVYVFQGALHHAGASASIVYGIYPATAPLIVVGGAAASYGAAKENWRDMGFAIAAVALAAGAAYAGPSGVWAVMGIGLCVLVLAYAAALLSPRHA
jgi:hypothetical protein